MDSFVFDAFVCGECHATNPERDVVTFIGGDYAVECDQCGGLHTFGNVFEENKYAAWDAYNDMVRGK